MYRNYREAYFSERVFNSDKWDHYFDIYDHLLSHLYGKDINFLEIGVQNGGSLEVARKLFGANTKILGVDIDPQCRKLEAAGVADKIITGSQVDEQCLNEVVRFMPAIDVLIDDGSHVQSHMILSFINLFPAIAPNGIYIIEDTHTNYSPEHQESFLGIGLYDYFKGLAERLNIDFIDADLRKTRYKIPREQRPPRNVLPDICREIFSIEFFDSVIAVRKRKKLEPLRIRK
ncbi:MAG: CmcI family methyltransferase [Betaproteobacteria bacterium]